MGEPGDPAPLNPLRWQRVTPDGHGVLWLDWAPADYYTFFAKEMGWPPTVTRAQPVGVLDVLADDILQPRIAKQTRPEKATEKLALIAGHKQAG